MEKFIETNDWIKHFQADEEFRILNIGYHDFHAVKPLHTFHTQGFYTWHFVLSGKGKLEMAGKEHHLCEGDMFFIPPATTMRYFPDETDPWEYMWLAVKGEKMAYYGELLGFSLENASKKSGSFQKIKHILRSLFDRTVSAECGYYGALAAFYELVDICTARSVHTEMQRVRELIDASFTMPAFRIEELCADVGLSHPHLLRLFKKTYGETPVRYLIKKRMSLAKELLEETDLSVCSVAYSCGYTDEFHFMKCFKRYVGVTALSYRKTHATK